MKALIINLAGAGDRMAFMAAEMQALGLPYERIEAVTPQTLQPSADNAVWRRWQRPLRTTEMALCASHMAAWRRVMELGEPCLVLEDDALLATETASFLAAVAKLGDVDHVSLETRSRKKVVARNAYPGVAMRRLWQDRTGSAAYVVFPEGARKLLDHASQMGGPSDAVISSTYALRSYQADPALSIQLDQCAAYGVNGAIETRSSIDAEKKPGFTPDLPRGEQLAFRARRIMAQVRMGLRQFLHIFDAERRHVTPAREWVQTPSVSGKGSV